MNLQDVEIKTEYRSLIDNMTKDFYIPLLNQSTLYKRAVGFFSSSALIEISKGISGLVRNGGKIQMVASPHLSDDDIDAIKKGYEMRGVIKASLLKEMHNHTNIYEKDRLNLLANLIADGVLDIKIAFTQNVGEIGMYHEKMGILYDEFGNKVAFSGSMNESATAMNINYEAIDVFCSWDDEKGRVESKERAFNSIWKDEEPNIRIIDFPELKDEIIEKYKQQRPSYDVDKVEYGDNAICENSDDSKEWIRIPSDISLHDYQIEAILEWEKKDYRGIFDMATGTGKTYTGLGALASLSKKLDSNLGLIIVCPYQHLIEQWVEDIRRFNIKPIICYSSYDWKKKFKNTISDFNLGVIKNFCVITTNVTFATDFFQNEVDKLRGNACLVVDEAHNFGAKKQLSCMKPVFKYRLALSATLERHHDEIGTKKLMEYFGDKCIEYSLEKAIKEDKLTPYYYYPIPIYLDDDELFEYNVLTEKIIKMLLNASKDEPLPKNIETLLIKRARIIAGARNKLSALYKIISEEYRDDSHILVYCGATTVEDSCYKEGQVDNEEKRQIDIVVNMLGNDLDMRISKFTSEEKATERQMIKDDFSDGSMLQALIAIRCLDEGVNIPGIKTAFILASSTNPKEYIQRRGRVLRKAPNKAYAKIYDFITLPRDINSPIPTNAHLNSEYSLLKREMNRMEDFAKLAENSSESMKLINRINDFYKLNYIKGEDYGL